MEGSWIMKRVLLTVAVALLFPSLLSAAPVTIGVYYEGSIAITPIPWEYYDVALYMVQGEYDITAVEYVLSFKDIAGVPYDPTTGPVRFVFGSKVLPPKAQAEIGDPIDPTLGHSITFWPPLNGFPNGYDLLCSFQIYLHNSDCEQVVNHRIDVEANPASTYLRATYAPDGDKVDMVPLSFWICPDVNSVEEESWGAIKSLYK
jgi:hypothetical protein